MTMSKGSTGIQPAPEDDMSMGSNNDGEGYEGV